MPYVLVDGIGRIRRVSSKPMPGAASVPLNDPALLAFLREHGVEPDQVAAHYKQLADTDHFMARLAEDLVILLIRKGIISRNELQQETKDTINARTRLRLEIENAFNHATAKHGFEP